MPARSRLVAAATAALFVVPSLAACSGGGDEPGAAEAQSPEEVLAQASDTLVQTEGVQLVLTAGALPEGVSGIAKASGLITSAPAFDGSLTVVFAGQTVDVPVISVDDKVFAQLPFTGGAWDTVNPKEYGAPDPTDLIGPDGFPGLLKLTDAPEAGESVRGGADNSDVFTTYSGTVPGDAMDAIIPSSAGDSFDVEWQVNDDGELTKATMEGVFYPQTDPMTYTVEFSDYGTTKDITAPATK